MAKHTHTLRKKIRNLVAKSSTIDEVVNVMLALATNRASEYDIEKVPPATMRAAAKDLIEFGISSEKDYQALLDLEEELTDSAAVDKDNTMSSGVVIKMTAD